MIASCCVQKHCIFCRIARGQEPNKILYEVSQNQREISHSQFQRLFSMYEGCMCAKHLCRHTRPETYVHLQDDHYVAFNDIKPAAEQHILVITKAHIDSILALRPSLEDVNLGERLSLQHIRKQLHLLWEGCVHTT